MTRSKFPTDKVQVSIIFMLIFVLIKVMVPAMMIIMSERGMFEFDRQIGFSVTRSSFHFNLSMRWFKHLILLFKLAAMKMCTGSNEDRQ